MSGGTDLTLTPSPTDVSRADDISMDRRAFLLGTGTAITLGVDVVAPSQPKAETASSATRIDAHTHFSSLKFLNFGRKRGRAAIRSEISLRRPADTDRCSSPRESA